MNDSTTKATRRALRESDVPAIYVASLSDYNAGRLHGRWIALHPGFTEDDVWDEISDMLSESQEERAEEWAIHDTQHLPSALSGEHTDIQKLLRYADLLEYRDAEAVDAWLDDLDGASYKAYEWKERFEEAYRGRYDSKADFVAEMLEDQGLFRDLPAVIERYFSFDDYARDLELSGDVTFAEAERRAPRPGHRPIFNQPVHVFWNH